MKRYQFRLDQVRRVRQVQEGLAAAALADARRDEIAAEVRVLDRRASIAAATPLAGLYPADDVFAQRIVRAAQLEAFDAAVSAHAAVRRQALERRDDWSLASQRVKALDHLDERRREEHRVEADRTEAARIDDLVASRHRAQAAEADR